MDNDNKITQMSDKELLKKCLEAVSDECQAGAFLTTLISKEGIILDEVDEAQRITNRARAKLMVTNGKYVYLYLEFDEENDTDLKGFEYLYEQYLQNSTEFFLKSEEGSTEAIMSSVLTFDVIGAEDGETYKITLFAPIFANRDGATFKIAFDADDIRFGVEGADDTEEGSSEDTSESDEMGVLIE